jgi:hypothetical protein
VRKLSPGKKTLAGEKQVFRKTDTQGRFVEEYQNKVKQKISLIFWQHFPCTDPCRFFSSLIEPVSTIAVPDNQSSA